MDIREHMEIVGADGTHVGTVDRIEGSRIKLTKSDNGGAGHAGHHHYLKLSLVAGIEDNKVKLSENGDAALDMLEEA